MIFQHYAEALGEVDIRELLPTNFVPVPEPSTWLLMIAGIATFGAAKRVMKTSAR